MKQKPKKDQNNNLPKTIGKWKTFNLNFKNEITNIVLKTLILGAYEAIPCAPE